MNQVKGGSFISRTIFFRRLISGLFLLSLVACGEVRQPMGLQGIQGEPGQDAPVCEFNTDCGEGFACADNGQCVDLAVDGSGIDLCRSDDDCLGGEYCNSQRLCVLIPEPGEDGVSCTTIAEANGSYTMRCTDGTEVNWQDGETGPAGELCNVDEAPVGTFTMTCPDGSRVSWTDGTDGVNGEDGALCSVAQNPDGSATITCTNGTTATVEPGEDGTDGTNGTNCTTYLNGNGCAVIQCGSTASTVCSPGVTPPTDTDGDGIPDVDDNCEAVSNPNQSDDDLDGLGDVCDNDRDGDGVVNSSDNCLFTANPTQTDTDRDGIGDVCDNDQDDDNISDNFDNCPSSPNTNQADMDLDGIGDVCDDDLDGDGDLNNTDNCPSIFNPSQIDSDHDGFGDACDTPSPVCTTLRVTSEWRFQGVVSNTTTAAGLPIGDWHTCPDGDSSCQTITFCEGETALFNVQLWPVVPREDHAWAVSWNTSTAGTACSVANVVVDESMFIGTRPMSLSYCTLECAGGNTNIVCHYP